MEYLLFETKICLQMYLKKEISITRWRRMSADLCERHQQFEECRQQWQQYEDEYGRARMWLEGREQHFSELAAKKDHTRYREECLQQSKVLCGGHGSGKERGSADQV